MSSTDLPVLIKVEGQLLEEEVGELGRDGQEGVFMCVCVGEGGCCRVVADWCLYVHRMTRQRREWV